jgi:hypothetical protein
MGGVCSKQGRDEKFIQNFDWNTCSDHLEGLGVDGRIILETITEKCGERFWS